MRADDRPGVRFPPPPVFLVLRAIASVLEYRYGCNHPKGPLELRISLALILSTFSGRLALHAVIVLEKQGAFADTGRPTVTLVDDGPFGFSRNPMYLSLVPVLVGLFVLCMSIWFYLSAVVLLLVVDRTAMAPEELYLERKFGDRYLEYKSRVRKWI